MMVNCSPITMVAAELKLIVFSIIALSRICIVLGYHEQHEVQFNEFFATTPLCPLTVNPPGVLLVRQ